MRIVIDLQGAQTGSRMRGIGKYSMSLARAIAENLKDHDDHKVWILLNGSFPSTIEPIRGAFEGIMPQSRIKVFEIPLPAREMESSNTWRSRASERIREAVISDLNPDILLVTSLFEGWDSDAVVTVNTPQILTATILYDLIPFLYRENYLESSLQSQWYFRKLEFLKKSDLLMSISESSRRIAIEHLGLHPDKIVNIAGGVDRELFSSPAEDSNSISILRKHGVGGRFILYVPGGFDWRKNFRTLFKGFSLLPESLRAEFQLVVPGNIPHDIHRSFEDYIKSLDLSQQIIFPGFLSEEELSVFYSMCHLFVYPSLHEGLGFPVLEAMSCGAPVIGSNTTSVPEVISFPEALFDPESPEDMANRMAKALIDDQFRKALIHNGLNQASQFSWKRSAHRSIEAMEQLLTTRSETRGQLVRTGDYGIFSKRCLKLLAIKLDHMGDFALAIPAMVKLKKRYPYSSLDIIVGSWNADFARKLGIFDNVYHFDFFSSQSSLGPKIFEDKLNEVLGKLTEYDIAIDFRRQRDTRFLLAKTNAKLKVGYQSHYENIDHQLSICLPIDIDISEVALPQNGRSISLQMMDLVNVLPDDINDFLVLPKLSNTLREGLQVALFPKAGNIVREWDIHNYVSVAKWLVKDSRVDRINVYISGNDENLAALFPRNDKIHFRIGLPFEELCDSLARNSIALANNSGGAHLSSYMGLKLIEIFSGHELPEEWAPVYGANRIISVDVPCAPCHLGSVKDCRHEHMCLTQITPEVVLGELKQAIEELCPLPDDGFGHPRTEASAPEVDASLTDDSTNRLSSMTIKSPARERLLHSLADLDGSPSYGDLISTARTFSVNFPSQIQKELLVDVSELYKSDGKTGVHRVVRSILSRWLHARIPGLKVMPIYCANENGYLVYRYAEGVRSSILGQADHRAVGDVVEPVQGDIFVGLDLSHHGTLDAAESGILDRWRNRGVRLSFVIYDLLHIRHPEWFIPNTHETIVKWMTTVARVSDVLACISKSVSDDVKLWLQSNPVPRFRKLTVNHFRLSGELDDSTPTRGISEKEEKLLQKLHHSMIFLAVGTIEPRKGYVQLLAAFEALWRLGSDFALVIVGKNGWLMDDLVRKILEHPELKKRLFWFSGCSDECLEKLYHLSTCLVAPSEGEGFGLPLVEASRYDLPIIARDISVFREMLEDGAFYFLGNSPEDLANAVMDWMSLHRKGQLPRPTKMLGWTWAQSAEQLLDRIQQ